MLTMPTWPEEGDAAPALPAWEEIELLCAQTDGHLDLRLLVRGKPCGSLHAEKDAQGYAALRCLEGEEWERVLLLEAFEEAQFLESPEGGRHGRQD